MSISTEHSLEAENWQQGKVFSFPRKRKLKQQKIVKELFTKSSSVFLHPYKILFLIGTQEEKPKILISVPKKNFKKAVSRNRIKRQITEAFRLQEPFLPPIACAALAITYVGKEEHTSIFMQQRLNSLLKKLLKERAAMPFVRKTDSYE